MDKRTVKDIQLTGKRVLVRVDYNVPMNDKGEITDFIRIEASLPTLHYLLDQGAAVILLAHLGRPKGKVNPKFSLKPVAEALSQLIHRPVQFCSDCVGKEAQAAAAQLRNGDILLLENLRFHPEEEKNDPHFAQELASLGDVFVNDGPMPLWKALPIICRLWPVSCWKRKSPTWAMRWINHSVLLPPSSAGPK